MDTYIVTGLIGYCIYSIWTEIAISVEVQAANTDQARDKGAGATAHDASIIGISATEEHYTTGCSL